MLIVAYKPFMLSAIMVSAIMLNAILVNAFMLNVVTPKNVSKKFARHFWNKESLERQNIKKFFFVKKQQPQEKLDY